MQVNGRTYPLLSQFVDNKEEFIGGVMTDFDGRGYVTKIVDIVLKPNGEDSAFFEVVGEDFNCGFDVELGRITENHYNDGIAFSRMYIGTFTIQKKEA